MKNRIEELIQALKDYTFPLTEPKDYDNICGFCEDILEEYNKAIELERKVSSRDRDDKEQEDVLSSK